MEGRAYLRHLRIAPRKVRLVVNLVRGRRVDQAIDQLSVLPKGAARPVLKLIQSAVANARHNFQLDEKTLIIKSITANEGPRLKRYRPRAFGRAAEILKRSSHITVILEGQPAVLTKTEKTVTAKPTPGPKPPAEKKTSPKAAPLVAKHPKRSSDKIKAEDAADKVIRRQGKE